MINGRLVICLHEATFAAAGARSDAIVVLVDAVPVLAPVADDVALVGSAARVAHLAFRASGNV